MLIGLISDSHVPETAKQLPEEIAKAFQGVELILHAGDIYIPAALDQLQQIAPVLAARGDDDTLSDPRVKEKYIFTIHGHKIGMTHAFFGTFYFVGVEREMNRIFGGPVDIVIHGHTHTAKVAKEDGTLIINPGSPLLPNYTPRLGSVGLLSINNGQVDARIVELGQPK